MSSQGVSSAGLGQVGRWRALALILACCAALSCGGADATGTPPAPPPPPPPAKPLATLIGLALKELSSIETVSLTIEGRLIWDLPDNPKPKVRFEIPDSSTLKLLEFSVDSGKTVRLRLHGVRPGSAYIYAITDSVTRYSVHTVDSMPDYQLDLQPKEPRLMVGDTVRFTVSVHGLNGQLDPPPPVTWSGKGIRIDSTGLATVTAVGDAEVHGELPDYHGNPMPFGTVVHGIRPLITRIEVDSLSEVEHGMRAQVNYAAFGADGKRYDVDFVTVTSASDSIAEGQGEWAMNSVAKVHTIGRNIGETLLHIAIDSAKAAARVRVKPLKVTSWDLALRDFTIRAGGGAGFNVLLFDADHRLIEYRKPVLSVSDTTIARAVLVSGVQALRGLRPGTTRVTMRADDLVQSANVTVLPAAVPATITLNEERLTRARGQTFQLGATVWNQYGELWREEVTWSSSDDQVATVSVGGRVTVVGVGEADIRASVASGLSKSMRVIGTPPPGSGPFEIELWFASNVPEKLRESMRRAASRLSHAVRQDLPDVNLSLPADACFPGMPSVKRTTDDLLIYVTTDTLGPYVAGAAGPCYLRGGSLIPALGAIVLNHLADRLPAEETDALALHEMLHAMGMTLSTWKDLALADTTVSSATEFTGARARAAYRMAGGTRGRGGVPLENDGEEGSRDTHWEYDVFRSEIFTATLVQGGRMPLSSVTVAALGDLGYAADTLMSDAFRIATPTNGRVAPRVVRSRYTDRILKPIGDTKRGVWRRRD